MGLIDEAIAREAGRPAPKRIDYERMNRVWPRQKAALTRAAKTGDPEKVAQVCKDAVRVWDEIGAWPDDWSLFQRTLDDALPVFSHVDIASL
jgi:hypothetical protein